MEYSIWLDVSSIFILLALFIAYKIKKSISVYRHTLLYGTIFFLLLNTFVDLIAIGLDGITNQYILYSLHSFKYILMHTSYCFMLVFTSISVNQRIHGINILKLNYVNILF